MNAFLFLSLFLATFTHAQGREVDGQGPFRIHLEPVPVTGFPGLHSFAFGRDGDTWLLVGGRLDGLHARQPNVSFPASSNNRRMMVIDPVGRQYWSAPLTSLPVAVQEQLQSTNMNFYQRGDSLYLVGGYGFSATSNNHITFPALTVLHVGEVIAGVKAGAIPSASVHHVRDERLAVTGGQLVWQGNQFLLVGGHRFDGRYNPMGGPSFTQSYTNALQRFGVGREGGELVIHPFSVVRDEVHLRRRDFNLLPFVGADGEDGHLISSGVFQREADLPFLYPVVITQDGYRPVPSFEQRLSHYHSPKVALFDAQRNEHHMVFFGGLAQYYFAEETLVQDDLVPFVSTISRVTRLPDGSFEEVALSEEMPDLRGTSAEFIPADGLPRRHNGTLMLDELPSETLIGYIVGGIDTPLRNPFTQNLTAQTTASPRVYAVYLTRSVVSSNASPILPRTEVSMAVWPTPFTDRLSVAVSGAQVQVRVVNVLGQEVAAWSDVRQGTIITWDASHVPAGIYIVTATYAGVVSSRVVMKR